MMAISCTAQPAMVAGRGRTERMPFAMPAMAMCMSAAAASTILIETGANTPVSLFVLALPLVVLLVSLVVLISLILTGLTGLVGLESLVGLMTKLATKTVQGD
jgi:NhaP-type Na+/H+ and K+/H+ antiporter